VALKSTAILKRFDAIRTLKELCLWILLQERIGTSVCLWSGNIFSRMFTKHDVVVVEVKVNVVEDGSVIVVIVGEPNGVGVGIKTTFWGYF